MEEWRYSYILLDFGTMWKCVVSLTSQLLYPQGKSPWYTLDRRLDGPERMKHFICQ
jgi:hypothetical protein